jgi:hypothetical protein
LNDGHLIWRKGWLDIQASAFDKRNTATTVQIAVESAHALPTARRGLPALPVLRRYVLHSRGVTRISLTFFMLCATTFCWQFTWAVLFQMRTEHEALALAKLGYLLILFLPTTLYHFVAELTASAASAAGCNCRTSWPACSASSCCSSDWLIAGVYPYFFGFYPKAGALHALAPGANDSGGGARAVAAVPAPAEGGVGRENPAALLSWPAC